MFILSIFDRNGQELKEGDFVKVSNGKEFTFFSEVKYIESEGVIAPFHTFSFHSFEKINEIPIEARKCLEERYDIWHMYSDTAEQDEKSSDYEKYLMSWRVCEHRLDKRSWAIKKENAALIASAPKMLEALQNLENDNGSIPEHAWKLVQDAINSALEK